MQALSPHQARAQFLGEKELGWGGSRGGLAEEGRVLRRPFPLYRSIFGVRFLKAFQGPT